MNFTLPSLTTLTCAAFLTYMGYSIWTLVQLFIPPDCPATEKCIQPLIKDNPKLQVSRVVYKIQDFCSLNVVHYPMLEQKILGLVYCIAVE